MLASDSSVAGFLDKIADAQCRSDARALVGLLREATGETPKMRAPSIIGFGSYHYRYESGREGDAPLLAFSPRKSASVLYLHLGLADSDALLARLGKHMTGKGCLNIRKPADVDEKVLRELVAVSIARMREKYFPA